MKTIELPLTKLGWTCIHDRYHTREDHVASSLISELSGYFLSEQQDPYVYKLPSNRWEYFKHAVFPNWLLKKFPIKYTEISLDIKTIYPRLKTTIPPDMQGIVTICIAGKRIGSFYPELEGRTIREYNEQVVKTLQSSAIAQYEKCPYCDQVIFRK